MTMQKAAVKAAELTNAEYGSHGEWVASDFLGPVLPSSRAAFARFVLDADAAARKAIDAMKANPASDALSIAERVFSPFILPDDVDPLLIEARRMVADLWVADTAMSRGAINDVRTGNDDSNLFVVAALTALRRGLEIAEARK